MKCTVLISTRQILNRSSFQRKELDLLSDDKCRELFLKYSNYQIKENEEDLLQKIISYTANQTLVIELLAKIFKKSFELITIHDLLVELEKKKV